MITIPIIESHKALGKADGTRGKDYPYGEYVSVAEGNMLYEMVCEIRPKVIVELGMGLATGTLYMLQALADCGLSDSKVLSIDPSIEDRWTGVALKLIERAGLGSYHLFLNENSEFALPHLVQSGLVCEFAFLDSNHQFDQTMLELFFIEKALRVGGSIAFHDTNLLSVQSVCNFAQTNLGYTSHPMNEDKTRKQECAMRVLTKTAQPPRPWFHFVPFEVPTGDQMAPFLEAEAKAR